MRATSRKAPRYKETANRCSRMAPRKMPPVRALSQPVVMRQPSQPTLYIRKSADRAPEGERVLSGARGANRSRAKETWLFEDVAPLMCGTSTGRHVPRRRHPQAVRIRLIFRVRVRAKSQNGAADRKLDVSGNHPLRSARKES